MLSYELNDSCHGLGRDLGSIGVHAIVSLTKKPGTKMAAQGPSSHALD
jgi:hypothetical protein